MKNKLTLFCFVIIVLITGVFITQVKINYNLEKYLPKDSVIRESMDVYQEEFGDSSTAYVVFNETSIVDALDIKNQISNVENVEKVLFVDDYLNQITYMIIREQTPTAQQPMLDSALASELNTGKTYSEALLALANFFPPEYKNQILGTYADFVSEEEVLMQIVFSTGAADATTENSLNLIKEILVDNEYDYYLQGDAVSTIFTRNTIGDETTTITLIIIPIIIIILLLLSKSIFDIVIFIIVAGSAIIINLGTNAFLPEISFITQAMAIALQLAISLDYIIFMLNAYHHERGLGLDVEESINQAYKRTKKPIIASALTTGVSFLALLVMKFTIGIDIGLVFAKGIMISLITTLFLLPVLIKYFAKIIDKTKTKTKILNFSWFANFAEKAKKFRYLFLGFLLILITPLIILQTQENFTYGVSSFSGGKGTSYFEDGQHIEENFGKSNTYIILVNKSDQLENQLYQELNNLDFVEDIKAGIYYKNVISDQLVLNQITSDFYSENYAIFQVLVATDVESDLAFENFEIVRDTLDGIDFEDTHILGETAVSYYLKDLIVSDFSLVLIVAVIAVILIIFISFKNLLIPIILTVVIETAVFLSMSILYLFDQNLIFLAYLIVTTILLGATIDYAILFSKRYMEERETKTKDISIRNASLQATPSLVTSAMLFIIAGLTIFFISSISSISQIGLLIALGAFVALIFVLVILPQILYIFDKFIIKSKF
jgi:uncharacterized protein